MAIHVNDFSPPVGISLPVAIDALAGAEADRMGAALGAALLMMGAAFGSPLLPACVSLSVNDPKIVDEFLDQLDKVLPDVLPLYPEDKSSTVESYPAVLTRDGTKARCLGVVLGPVTLRFYFARIGNGLHFATSRDVLEKIAAAQSGQKPPAADQALAEEGHIMFRVRIDRAKQLSAGSRLTEAEHNRRACLSNCASLEHVARAVAASGTKNVPTDQLLAAAEPLYAGRFFCPDQGRYEVSPDAKRVTCSVHGSTTAPRQPPIAQGEAVKALVSRVTATLSFLEDGLRAVVVIDR